MTIMHPVVNNNGTTKMQLVEQRLTVVNAIEAAMKALQEMKPHGRDYQTAPEGRYEEDRTIWNNRFATLDTLRNSLQDEALSIHGDN